MFAMPIESLHQALRAKSDPVSVPEAGAERRKCDRVMALWHRARRDRDLPEWSEAFRRDARELGDFFVVGVTDLKTSMVTVEDIGGRFRHALDTSRANWSETGMAAAVLVKEIVEAANWIRADLAPGPIAGEYPDLKMPHRTIKSRFVVLPFSDGAPGRLRWVALGDWCAQDI
jgi:uncharacterized protein YbjT (DUF2867 family)